MGGAFLSGGLQYHGLGTCTRDSLARLRVARFQTDRQAFLSACQRQVDRSQQLAVDQCTVQVRAVLSTP